MNKYYITGRVNGEIKGTMTVIGRGEVEAWEKFRRAYSKDDCQIERIVQARPDETPAPRPTAQRSFSVMSVGLLAGCGKTYGEVADAHGETPRALDYWMDRRGLNFKKLRAAFDASGVAGLAEIETWAAMSEQEAAE